MQYINAFCQYVKYDNRELRKTITSILRFLRIFENMRDNYKRFCSIFIIHTRTWIPITLRTVIYFVIYVIVLNKRRETVCVSNVFGGDRLPGSGWSTEKGGFSLSHRVLQNVEYYLVTTDRNEKKWRPFFDTRTRAATVPVTGRMRAVPETAARTDDHRFPTPVRFRYTVS